MGRHVREKVKEGCLVAGWRRGFLARGQRGRLETGAIEAGPLRRH